MFGDDQLNQQIKDSPLFGWRDFFRFTEPGLFLEFGVADGGSLRNICSIVTDPVFGFDSFQGLPEAWIASNGVHNPKGQFKVSYPPANLPLNARLVTGLFQDTLPKFLQEHPQPISLIHIDCDLYSSTKFVFDQLKDRLNRTVIVFDEIIGLAAYEEHEGRAFREFLQNNPYTYHCLGHHHNHGAAFKLYKG